MKNVEVRGEKSLWFCGYPAKRKGVRSVMFIMYTLGAECKIKNKKNVW